MIPPWSDSIVPLCKSCYTSPVPSTRNLVINRVPIDVLLHVLKYFDNRVACNFRFGGVDYFLA